MKNPLSLQEKKKHGEIRFPFNIYPCTIPGDFPQVALHWHDSMELVFVKRGHGFIQMGVTVCRAQEGDIFIFSPGLSGSNRCNPPILGSNDRPWGYNFLGRF